MGVRSPLSIGVGLGCGPGKEDPQEPEQGWGGGRGSLGHLCLPSTWESPWAVLKPSSGERVFPEAYSSNTRVETSLTRKKGWGLMSTESRHTDWVCAAVWPQVSFLTSLNLRFLICKMGITVFGCWGWNKIMSIALSDTENKWISKINQAMPKFQWWALSTRMAWEPSTNTENSLTSQSTSTPTVH